MKLTTKALKSMIMEVLNETSDRGLQKTRILGILKGNDPDIDSVAIMSSQNPMAKPVSNTTNRKLHRQILAKLQEDGVEYEEIGGVFGGLSEKALLLINPSKQYLDELNRQFTQWGFVYGKRVFQPSRGPEGEMEVSDDGISGEYKMQFQMMEIDYDEEAGYNQDPESKTTDQVLHGDRIGRVRDNYSHIPHMGDEGKFAIPLYGKPFIPMTDEEMEQALASLGSPSQTN